LHGLGRNLTGGFPAPLGRRHRQFCSLLHRLDRLSRRRAVRPCLDTASSMAIASGDLRSGSGRARVDALHLRLNCRLARSSSEVFDLKPTSVVSRDSIEFRSWRASRNSSTAT
jgi:hypothetical protein